MCIKCVNAMTAEVYISTVLGRGSLVSATATNLTWQQQLITRVLHMMCLGLTLSTMID